MDKRTLIILSLGLLLIAAAVCGALLFEPFFQKPPEEPTTAETAETGPEQKPAPAVKPPEPPGPGPDPGPEAEPENYTPSLTETDGVTVLEIEGTSLVLANKVYPLPPDFGGEDHDALTALSEMIAEAVGDGISLFVVSGYRSYATQESIYNSYVNQWGQEYTDRVSARPGHSEHQTGLAFDLNSLENAFKDTEEFHWLTQRAADFGFILRYPEGSEWATGYAFEPWHYRYIGDVSLAKNIMDSGLSLEEYAGIITEEGQSSYRD